MDWRRRVGNGPLLKKRERERRGRERERDYILIMFCCIYNTKTRIKYGPSAVPTGVPIEVFYD